MLLDKRLILVFLTAVLFFAEGDAVAQYNSGHSFGIRLGNEISVDYKYDFTANHGLDVKLGVVNPFTKHYQFSLVSAAYIYSINTGSFTLYPYIGAGFSTGMQFGHWAEPESSKITYFLSVDVPIGLEYRLAKNPVVFSLEWSPKYQFLKYSRFIAHSVSLGVRYIFPNYKAFRR